MKSMLTLVAALIAALGLAVCAGAAPLRVASDGAQIQRENPAMPTRVAPENGTKILMHFGDTVIPGVLNDGETAQALVKMLPYKVRVSRYSHDFCGIMDDPLPYKEEDVHHGWLNGDDEENSEQYGYQVNIGVITCELSKIAALEGSYEVLIELAK